MKKTLFCLFISFSPFFGKAQVNFGTFANVDALSEQASKEKKLIFIQLESTNCEQCNDVAMTGLSSTLLKEKYASNFVSLHLKIGDNLRTEFIRKYKIREGMGSFYFDADNNLLFKNTSTTSNAIIYMEWADKAIGNASKTADFTVLEQIYKSGDRTPAFLEKYIRALRGLDRDADGIMNQYIGKLPVDSLQSERVIRFVYEQGLSLNATAYKKIELANSKNTIDNIWYSMPDSKRRMAANRTINQTFNEAIRYKNRSLAICLNDYTRSFYGKNFRKGQFMADIQLINFYRAIKDTTTFFQKSMELANSIVSTHFDSISTWERQGREGFYTNSGAMPEKITYIPNQYSNELNSLAWQYYEVTTNQEYLEQALIWSERSMALYKHSRNTPNVENPAYLDTYAHILYRLKRYDEAIEWQNKAIEAQKLEKIKSEGYEKERDKMINRKL